MNAKKIFLMLAIVAGLAGCGGGGDNEQATPQAVDTALRAQANSLAAPTVAQAADQLMDFGERTFPFLFAHGPNTIAAGPFLFRFYPQSNLFLGVVVTDGSPFLLNHVYVVGPGFGTLSDPHDFGVLTNFITPQDTGTTPPVPVNKNLVVTVDALGQSVTVQLGVSALPTEQSQFCSEISPGTIFAQALAGTGVAGSLTITSCSFSVTSGTVNAIFALTAPIVETVPVTIHYSFE